MGQNIYKVRISPRSPMGSPLYIKCNFRTAWPTDHPSGAEAYLPAGLVGERISGCGRCLLPPPTDRAETEPPQSHGRSRAEPHRSGAETEPPHRHQAETTEPQAGRLTPTEEPPTEAEPQTEPQKPKQIHRAEPLQIQNPQRAEAKNHGNRPRQEPNPEKMTISKS